MAKTTANRVGQALGKVVRSDGSHYWVRISRRNFDSLVMYWRTQPNFKYMKIYRFNRQTRQIGTQIGYITLNGSRLSPEGINETYQSQQYKASLQHKR